MTTDTVFRSPPHWHLRARGTLVLPSAVDMGVLTSGRKGLIDR